MSVNPSPGADLARAAAAAVIYLPGCEPVTASPPGRIRACLLRIRGYGAAPRDDRTPAPGGLEFRVYWWRNRLWRGFEGPRWLRLLRAVPLPYRRRLAEVEMLLQDYGAELDAIRMVMADTCRAAGFTTPSAGEAAAAPQLRVLPGGGEGRGPGEGLPC
jgi:hypothetical protein